MYSCYVQIIQNKFSINADKFWKIKYKSTLKMLYKLNNNINKWCMFLCNMYGCYVQII